MKWSERFRPPQKWHVVGPCYEASSSSATEASVAEMTRRREEERRRLDLEALADGVVEVEVYDDAWDCMGWD